MTVTPNILDTITYKADCVRDLHTFWDECVGDDCGWGPTDICCICLGCGDLWQELSADKREIAILVDGKKQLHCD